MNRHRQPTIRVRRAITQASNVMIESSLPESVSFSAMIESPLPYVSHKTAPYRAPLMLAGITPAFYPAFRVSQILASGQSSNFKVPLDLITSYTDTTTTGYLH